MTDAEWRNGLRRLVNLISTVCQDDHDRAHKFDGVRAERCPRTGRFVSGRPLVYVDPEC